MYHNQTLLIKFNENTFSNNCIDKFVFKITKVMNDAAPQHKTLYRWEKRQSTLDKPSKPSKHGIDQSAYVQMIICKKNIFR